MDRLRARVDLLVSTARASLPVLLCAISLATPAMAEPLVLRAQLGATYDDNVFRLPEGEEATFGDKRGRSDWIGQAMAGVRLEANPGLQQFVVDGSITRNEYARFSDISFTGVAAQGTWNWRVGSRLSGAAGVDYRRRQSNFAEFRALSPNIVEALQPYLDVRYASGSQLFAYGGYRRIDVTNSAVALKPANYAANITTAGAGYALSNGGELRAGYRHSTNDYDVDQVVVIGGATLPLRNDFRQNEAELNVNYPLSFRTRVTGRIAYTERKVPRVPARNFSGVTGNIAAEYALSELLKFQLSVRRELSGTDELFSNFVRTDAVRGWIEYKPRDYITVRLEGDRGSRDYRGLDLVVPIDVPDRKDKFSSASLAASYIWPRGNRLDLSVRHESRNSDLSVFDYKANTASVSFTMLF